MNAKAYNGAGGVGHYGVIQISATNLLKMNVDPNTFYQKYPTVESQLSLVSQYYQMITKQDLSNPVKALAATFCPASLTNGEGPSTVLSAKAQAANPGFVTMNDYSKASGYDCSVGSTNSSTTAALPASTTTTGLQVTLNTSKSASDNTTTHTTGSHK
jgi:hypothetical protein